MTPTFTVYFAGALFNHKDLTGNALLAAHIEQVHGKHPSLTELGDGDLKFTTDFRSLYQAVLEDWFGTKAVDVLGAEFPKLALIEGGARGTVGKG